MKIFSGSLIFFTSVHFIPMVGGSGEGGAMDLRQLPGSEHTNLRSLSAVLAVYLSLSMDGQRGEEETWIVVVGSAALWDDLIPEHRGVGGKRRRKGSGARDESGAASAAGDVQSGRDCGGRYKREVPEEDSLFST